MKTSKQTPVPPFSKVLVANRGEIAVRVMRTLRELGIGSVAVYSEADREALHVRYADEAYCVGPAESAASYLRGDTLIEVARRAGAEAVHPGYGFLAERASFAGAVLEAGLAWIGPPPSAIEAMGEKVRARQLMIEAGVPVVPGTEAAAATADEALEAASAIGFPVLLKASAGGGGKGMRRVDSPARLGEAFNSATREATAAFGQGDVYVEKLILEPKHVEFQIFGDSHGHVVHLFERDCSVQRRHQKVIEETPCAVLRPEVRDAMGRVAVQAAQAVGYENAGTVEFLLDANQDFYFLEMNTRLQVEHPVTEWCTGLDLVALQVQVAAGRPLPFEQGEVTSSGAAIEARLYAEDPSNNFLPSPGRLERLSFPSGPGVRIDAGVYEGFAVSPHYDPLMAKLTVWAGDRSAAIRRLERALDELVVIGVRTNVDFVRRALALDSFGEGTYDIGTAERHLDDLTGPADPGPWLEAAQLGALAMALERDDRATGQRPVEGAAAGSRWRQFGRWKQLQGS